MANDMSGGSSAPVSSAPSSAPASAPSSAPTTTQSPGSSQPTASSSAAAPSSTPAEVRRFKVKIDGVETEVDEGELVRGYGTTKAAQRRMDEAARLRRGAETHQQRLAEARKDPRKAMELLNDPDSGFPADVLEQVAEELLYKKIQQEQMSPEQRRIQELEAREQQRENEQQTQAQQREEAEYNQGVTQALENYNRTIVETLGKSNLPKTEYTVKRMAEYMYQNHSLKLNYSQDQIAELVSDDYKSDLSSFLDGMEGEQMLTWLGDKISNKLRKADLARLRSRGAAPPARIVDSTKQGQGDQRPAERLTRDQYLERIRQRSED